MRLCFQVHMNAHQHEAENRHIEAPTRFTQKLQGAQSIPIIAKDALPSVAAQAQIVDGAFKVPRAEAEPCSTVINTAAGMSNVVH